MDDGVISEKIKEIAMIDFNIHDLIDTISANDGMYVAGDTNHYFSVGRSALKAIIHSINIAGKKAPNAVLDLPCGHGRVLRYIRAKFPHASITACDMDRDGVDFCVKTFNAEGIYSQRDIRNISLHNKYDLIWCGSLLTHLDKNVWGDFIEFFSRHLNDQSILVFTTHGRLCVQRIEGHHTYGLDEKQLPSLLTQYRKTGFGYLNYSGSSEYGISVASPAYVLAEVQRHLYLKIIFFQEAGWDHHQDVIACIRDI